MRSILGTKCYGIFERLENLAHAREIWGNQRKWQVENSRDYQVSSKIDFKIREIDGQEKLKGKIEV